MALCVAVFDSDDRLLVTRRSLTLKGFPGAWVLPGGHLELDEDLEEGALRELREETGILIVPGKEPGTYSYAGHDIGPLEAFYAFESAAPNRAGEGPPGS